MPQVDLETLVCSRGSSVCGDPKVACESTLVNIKPTTHDPVPIPDPEHYETDPDLPAESFHVSIADYEDIDSWLDISAVYDRDDSTKGTTNPKSNHHHNHKPPVLPTSQRFSGNLKAPIIGLPNTIQHSGYLGHSARRQHVRIFPKKGVKVSDPGSPKVSCFGKVLSERERRSRRRSLGEGGKGGCFNFRAVFWCFRGRRKEEAAAAAEVEEVRVPARERRAPAEERSVVGLGGMKRFVSGRRPASWGGDVEVGLDLEEHEGAHVSSSGPLDRI